MPEMTETGSGFRLLDAELEDYPRLVAINQEAVPAVGDTDLGEFTQLAGKSSMIKVAAAKGELIAFLMVLDYGVDYASENYRWFSERYEDFAYIDRVAVTPEWKGRGIGRQLYESVFSFAKRKGKPMIACEVNVKPLNQASLDFHARLGFSEVGQQDTQGGKKRVSLLVRRMPQKS